MTTRDVNLKIRLTDNMQLLESKLSTSHEREKNYAELRVVEAIQRNPKFFYKYVREKAKIKSTIGPLKVNEELVGDTGRVCEILRAQYDSVFSEPLPDDVLRGLDGGTGASVHHELMDVIFNEDNITEAVERAHKTGPVSSSRPRIVTARFEKFHEREAVMRNARKLNGSNICIDEDLCPTSQEIRKSQIPLMKKARAEGKIAFFKHTRLIIKDKSDNYQPQDSSRNEGVSTHEEKSDVTEAVDRTGARDCKPPDDSIRGAVGESPAEPLMGVWARNARTRSRRKQ
ncbi:hypothetical protein Pcinc_000192 [Petrolisthes cinctipes]|uniref:Uncharacterized protein n=1 Tax=Petrolisthes cinctipes TaxID=88211 RepID=A0AAE1L499_PETCI|nr:hypothetical protein Pcinc_000192 [Petrolisthes cinctipes]